MQRDGTSPLPVRATRHGFVVRLELDALEAAIGKVRGEVEIVVRVAIGSFVAFQDSIAEITTRSTSDGEALADAVLSVCRLRGNRGRNILFCGLFRRSVNMFSRRNWTARFPILVRTLKTAERFESAGKVKAAQQVLNASLGRIGSRATRVQSKP